jgi:hypothetical protein
MENFQPRIALKQADGSFLPLFSGYSQSKKRFTVSAAHDGQDRAVLEFFLLKGDTGEAQSLVSFEFEDLKSETREQPLLEITGTIDIVENLALTVRSLTTDDVQTSEINLTATRDEDERPAGTGGAKKKSGGSSVFSAVLIGIFLLIGLAFCLFSAYLIGSRLSTDPYPPLKTSFLQSGSRPLYPGGTTG